MSLYLHWDHDAGIGGVAASVPIPSRRHAAPMACPPIAVRSRPSRSLAPTHGTAALAVAIAALVHWPIGSGSASPASASIPSHDAFPTAAAPMPETRDVWPTTPATAGPGLLRLTGTIGATLYGTQRAAGAPSAIVAQYIQAIAPRIPVAEIAAPDRYDLVYTQKRAPDGALVAGQLLYAGIVHDGTPLALMRVTLGGRDRWLDASGAGETHSGFTMPVTGAQLSSGFGMRFHPILGFSRMHQGVDLAAPIGTPIVAASDGVVGFAGSRGELGNFVRIAHAGGLGTGYGHMSAIVVHPGQSVRQGELIGYVGSSGLSTGPHCHFEVYRDGVAIDPASADFTTTDRLAGADLDRFTARLAQLMAIPAG